MPLFRIARMYSWCGKLVSRWPIGTVLAWVVILILVITIAPPMSEVATDGEFDFLPYNSDSLSAERLFRKAFPVSEPAADEPVGAEGNAGVPGGKDDQATPPEAEDHQAQMDPLGCSVVIVLQREDEKAGLTAVDLEFVTKFLEPGLRMIQSRTGHGKEPLPLSESPDRIPVKDQIIRGVWTFEDAQSAHSSVAKTTVPRWFWWNWRLNFWIVETSWF